MEDSQKDTQAFSILFEQLPIDAIDKFALDENQLLILYETKIFDFEDFKLKMMGILQETCWMSDILNELDKSILKENARRTLNTVINQMGESLAKDKVSKEFKEYAISICSLAVLRKKCKCLIVPLSEILKESASGNPGFDFYAISTDRTCVFGESKYRAGNGAYQEALSQIETFIYQGKHISDCDVIKKISPESAEKCIKKNEFSFAIGFSGHRLNAMETRKRLSKKHIESANMREHNLYAILIRHDGLF